jgi:hypothetical protein
LTRVYNKPSQLSSFYPFAREEKNRTEKEISVPMMHIKIEEEEEGKEEERNISTTQRYF